MNLKSTYDHFLRRPVPIAPLITFRILFGGLMMFGALRFMWTGWVERLYVEPKFFFNFYGFGWVEPLGLTGMYLLYGLIALSAGMVMLGLCYRMAIIIFFLTFTYSELIDVTNYLNHYYLVVLLAFMMIFLPAARRFSVDTWRRPERAVTHVPAWTINLLIIQISIVYFFAGFAKLNPDWLFRAMPLAVWLPANAGLPLIGWLFEYSWVAFAFSWAGAFYDLTIPLWLSIRASRPLAYAAVVVFHVLTKLLFNIGLFPFIMIFSTLLFFPAAFHERLLRQIGYRPGAKVIVWKTPIRWRIILKPALALYLLFQIFLPLRHLLYPGDVLWTEEGYRFSWRVMLVEKAGQATFYVKDPVTGRTSEVINSEYLTPFQEKQMAIQPGLMLQFAHFLKEEYQKRYGIEDAIVTVESHVALNGRTSCRFIRPDTDLAKIRDGWKARDWVLRPENPVSTNFTGWK